VLRFELVFVSNDNKGRLGTKFRTLGYQEVDTAKEISVVEI
jgi:hypothetical protein